MVKLLLFLKSQRWLLSTVLILLRLNSFSQIVITEISYNPPESGSDSTEYIELFNSGTLAINLTGYSFTSGVNYTFPNVSIAANSYLVVSVDSVAMQNVYGVSALEWTSGALSNGGEPVALKDNLGNVVDSLRYDDNAPWPSETDGGGASLVLCNTSLDNKDGNNWGASTTLLAGKIVNGKQVYGSPGTANNCIINYCSSRSTRNRFEWIKQVKMEDDIDQLSNADGSGYGDYTDQVLIVDTNDVVTVELTPGYRRRIYEEFWRIWVDWNFDGDFNDSGEKVFEQNGKNVRTGSFTVPVNVEPEDLGMRVSMRWKRHAPTCGNFRNGEVEDYLIRVNGAQGYINPGSVKLAQGEQSISNADLYEFIDIYPNPVLQGEYVSGLVRVEETGVKQIQIVNSLGQIVKTESIYCDEEENRFDISTKGLAKGIYFINIGSGMETAKIIVW